MYFILHTVSYEVLSFALFLFLACVMLVFRLGNENSTQTSGSRLAHLLLSCTGGQCSVSTTVKTQRLEFESEVEISH